MRNVESFISLCAVVFIGIAIIACLIPAVLIIILVVGVIYWIYNICSENKNNMLPKDTNITKNFKQENEDIKIEENYNYFNDDISTSLDNSKLKNNVISNEGILNTGDLKTIRDSLNNINISNCSKETLEFCLKTINSQLSDDEDEVLNKTIKKLSTAELRKYVEQMKDLLNNADLESRITISMDELLRPLDNISNLTEYENDKDTIIGTATVAGALLGEDNSKNRRIKQKREQLAKLQREHGFAKSFAPNWDPSEGLYSKYNDEEKYLDAKILEVKQKNLSYDMYLSEDEKRMFKDDISPGYWED